MDYVIFWIKRQLRLFIYCVGLLTVLSICLINYGYNNKLALPKFIDPILIDNKAWIISIDNLNHEPILNSAGLTWSVVSLPVNDRCTALTNGLSKLVLKILQHGGRYIFIASEIEKSLPKLLSRFHYDANNISVAKYTGDYTHPIILHFHGLPDIDTLNRDTAFNYDLSLWNAPVIQKLVQPTTSSFSFDGRAPPILVPFGKNSPFIIKNVLFHYDALWALTSYFGDDVQWSLVVQRLLQELNSSVLFKTMYGIQASSCSDKSRDNTQFLKDLSSWKCVNRTSFYKCVLSLSGFMAEKKYIKKTEYENLETWLKQLKSVGYKEPLIKINSQKALEYVHKLIYRPAKDQTFKQIAKTRFKKWCPAGIPKCPMKDPQKLKRFKPIEHIILVIVFNRVNHYDYLDYLEQLYRPHFKYIQVCGLDIKGFRSESKKLNTTLSFLEVNKATYHDGYRHHQCIQQIIRMGYSAEGYLVAGDDVLMNIWNLVDIPTHKLWFQQDIHPANLTQPTVPDVWRNPTWWPWQSGEGRVAVKRAFDELETKRMSDSVVNSFLDQLAKNTNGKNRVYYGVSDMYYVPQVLEDLYYYFISVLNKHNVYVEIATPTVMGGLADVKNFHTIKAMYLWYGDRKFYREVFNYERMFQHPMKITPCFLDKNCTEFLCGKYLSCVTGLDTF